MKDLLKRWFDAWVKQLWLHQIEKATEELRRATLEVGVKAKVLLELLRAYEEKYPSKKEG